MEILIYILIFISSILSIIFILTVTSEIVRQSSVRRNLRYFHIDIESGKEIDNLQYQKFADFFDSIKVADIEYSFEFERMLKAFKKLDSLNNPPEQNNVSSVG